MKNDALSSRPIPAVSDTIARPRPTAAAALLLAWVLSLPFAVIALGEALLF